MATLEQDAVGRRLGHANSTAEFARVSPRHADSIADLTARTLRFAAPSCKALGIAGGVTQKRGSAWWREGRGSPLYDAFAFLYALARNPKGRPGAVVAAARSILRETMLPISDADLVQRFRDLKGEEDSAEGAENAAGSRVPWTGDLLSYERALLDEASVQEELAAVCRELRRRNVDPYRWGR